MNRLETNHFTTDAAELPANDEHERKKLIRAGQIAFLPAGVLMTLLGSMLSILIARWGLSDAQAGNLFFVQFLAQTAGVLLSAFLLARMGFRPPFLSGLLLMGCGVATLYLGPLWLGLVSVAVYGLGTGLLVPTDNLLVAEIGASSTTSSASAVTLLNFFWGVGAVVSALVVAWAQSRHLLSMFLGSVAVFLFLLAAGVRSLSFPGAVKSSGAGGAWRDLWRGPVIWLYVVVFFLYPGAETAVWGWVGSYVLRMGSHSAAIGSMIPAFFFASMTLGRGLGSLVLRHLAERRVLQAGYALGTAGIAILLWSSTLSVVMASMVLTGLSFATLYPVTVARFSRRYGVAARRLGSVMFSLAALGPALLPKLVGSISNATGNLRSGLAVPFVATLILLLMHIPEW